MENYPLYSEAMQNKFCSTENLCDSSIGMSPQSCFTFIQKFYRQEVNIE